MKCPATILALYLLFLAIYPCKADACPDGHEKQHTNQVADSHDDDDGQAKSCTPFCVDKCCNVHIYCQPAFQLTTAAIEHKTVSQTSFTEDFPPLVISAIWQPPRNG